MSREPKECPLCFKMISYSSFSKHYNSSKNTGTCSKLNGKDKILEMQKRIDELEKQVALGGGNTYNIQNMHVQNNIQINLYDTPDQGHITADDLRLWCETPENALINYVTKLEENPENKSIRKIKDPETSKIEMQRRQIGHCNNIPIWKTVNDTYLISNTHKLKQSALTRQTNDIGDYRYSNWCEKLGGDATKLEQDQLKEYFEKKCVE